MEVFHEAPAESSFTPISEHQSQTPASFYSGPPVLYFKGTHGQLLCLKHEATRHPAFENLVKDSTSHEDHWLVEDLGIWVASDKLILWRSSSSLGIAIPYPSISLHALGSISSPTSPDSKVQALYLEIIATDGFDDHDQEGTIALNYVPQLHQQQHAVGEPGTDTPSVSIPQQLYDAVTDCANLHPDPVSPSSSQANEGEDEDGEDEDGPIHDYEVLDSNGFPPAFPGSGGWITSENMDQFFDEHGNWRGRGLGPGAGMVRGRDDLENGVNGHSDDVNGEDETKWRRTD